MNIAFIPVRCGSKAIPFKNIKDFCGKPLVYWNLLSLQNSDVIHEIYVATDCEEIKTVVEKFNFSKVNIYERDEENATDTASTESVMLEFIRKQNFNQNDFFFLVQATSPLSQTIDFDKAYQKLISEKADSLLTCVRTKRFFWNEDAKPINYDYSQRPRRQDFEGLLMENGAFYINSIGRILRDENRLSDKIAIHEMPEYTSFEIDEEDDWIVLEQLMKKHVLPTILDKVPKIKLFLSDVDGTLTDAGMYYGDDGSELKKFNTHDGKAFELLRKAGIKTGILTSESSKIVSDRAIKLKVDYLYQGIEHQGKLDIVKKICQQENISLKEVAYIGDDINCKELLENVGLAACPKNAVKAVKEISQIIHLSKKGGDGVVREFVNTLLM